MRAEPIKQRRQPRYTELANELRTAIERGDYPVGSLLPTELELCERHDISRHTARAALAVLSDAGLVRRRPGAGTRVIAQRVAMRYEHEVDTIDLLLQYGNSTHLTVLSARRPKASRATARDLGIAPGEDYLHLLALRSEVERRDEPIAVTEMLVPIHADTPVEALLDPLTAPRAVSALLEPNKLSQVEQIFDAASFSARNAKLLGLEEGDPCMRAQRLYHGIGGRLLMQATSLHPRGRFAYRVVLARGAPQAAG